MGDATGGLQQKSGGGCGQPVQQLANICRSSGTKDSRLIHTGLEMRERAPGYSSSIMASGKKKKGARQKKGKRRHLVPSRKIYVNPYGPKRCPRESLIPCEGSRGRSSRPVLGQNRLTGKRVRARRSFFLPRPREEVPGAVAIADGRRENVVGGVVEKEQCDCLARRECTRL